ncbi:M48 family metalloprotease [bacterium]|nr:M48 family metalloprotease [bacterium]
MKRGTITAILLAALLISACATVSKMGTTILENEGVIDKSQKDSIDKVAKAVEYSFQDLTEEQEYYLGRSVAARILASYQVYKNDKLTTYVNMVGTAVTFTSDRPEIYGGYHFLVLDSQEINAFACPGGFVFITRGLLSTCADEEALACVLAHEVGHICAKHGLKAIKKSRLTDAFGVLLRESSKHYNKEELTKLTGAFDGALGDIMNQLVVKGYSRKQEYEADRLGLKYAHAAGYAVSGMEECLQAMAASSQKSSGAGFFKTHPAPQDRLDKVNQEIASKGYSGRVETVRTKRFKKAVG